MSFTSFESFGFLSFLSLRFTRLCEYIAWERSHFMKQLYLTSTRIGESFWDWESTVQSHHIIGHRPIGLKHVCIRSVSVECWLSSACSIALLLFALVFFFLLCFTFSLSLGLSFAPSATGSATPSHLVPLAIPWHLLPLAFATPWHLLPLALQHLGTFCHCLQHLGPFCHCFCNTLAPSATGFCNTLAPSATAFATPWHLLPLGFCNTLAPSATGFCNHLGTFCHWLLWQGLTVRPASSMFKIKSQVTFTRVEHPATCFCKRQVLHCFLPQFWLCLAYWHLHLQSFSPAMRFKSRIQVLSSQAINSANSYCPTRPARAWRPRMQASQTARKKIWIAQFARRWPKKVCVQTLNPQIETGWTDL